MVGRAVKALSFLLSLCLSTEMFSLLPLIAVKFTKLNMMQIGGLNESEKLGVARGRILRASCTIYAAL